MLSDEELEQLRTSLLEQENQLVIESPSSEYQVIIGPAQFGSDDYELYKTKYMLVLCVRRGSYNVNTLYINDSGFSDKAKNFVLEKLDGLLDLDDVVIKKEPCPFE